MNRQLLSVLSMAVLALCLVATGCSSGGLKFGLYAPSWDYTDPPAPDPSTRTVYMTNFYMGNGGTG